MRVGEALTTHVDPLPKLRRSRAIHPLLLCCPYDKTEELFYHVFFPPGATQSIVGVYFRALYRALASSRTRLLDHTQRRATFGRTPLNE
jgi:hypothetical protein